MSMLRRLRGVVGTALIWGVTWSTTAALIRVVRHVVDPVERSWSELAMNSILPGMQYGFAYGAVMGAGFAGLVSLLARRRRTLDDISVRTFAAAGAAVAACAHLWVTGFDLAQPLLATSILLGAGTSGGMLLAARRTMWNPRVSLADHVPLPMPHAPTLHPHAARSDGEAAVRSVEHD